MLRVATYNPVKSSPKILSVKLNKSSFFLDEEVEGIVELTITSPTVLSDINISLFIIENWIEKISKDADRGDYIKQCLLSLNLNLPYLLNINSSLINFQNGLHKFPFKLKLPNNLSPSFEYPHGDKKAFLRYCLEIKIISPYIASQTSNYLLLKSRPKIEIDKHLHYESSIDVHKWGIVKKGNTTLKVSMTNNYFTCDEKANLNIIIDNSKGQMITDHCKIVVLRTVKVKNKNNNQVINKYEEEISVQILKTVVEDGKKKSFEASVVLKQEDLKEFQYKNEVRPFPDADYNFLVPSLCSKIVECAYNIKISLYFHGFVIYKERPRIYVPIFIVHQSIGDFEKYINNNNKNNEFDAKIIGMEEQNNNINLEGNNELPTKEMVENMNINNNNINAGNNINNINNFDQNNYNYTNDGNDPTSGDMGAPGSAMSDFNNNVNFNYNNAQQNGNNFNGNFSSFQNQNY